MLYDALKWFADNLLGFVVIGGIILSLVRAVESTCNQVQGERDW